jgi:hypothetical protein
MADSGRRWTVQDRKGSPIYLTEERWGHITDAYNHPEMMDYENHVKITLQKGQRRQEPLNPRKYRYSHRFDDLQDDFNHVVAIVLFGFDVNEEGETIPNNYVATAFLKHIYLKGGKE